MEWMMPNGAILGFIGIVIAELEEVEASTHKLKCKAFATKGMLIHTVALYAFIYYACCFQNMRLG